MKTCTKCHLEKPEQDFAVRSDSGALRGICQRCSNDYFAERNRQKNEALVAEDAKLVADISESGESLRSFGSPIERASAEALVRCGSIVAAAAELQLRPSELRAHLHELQRRAATRGWSPGHDMTKTTPQGYSVKGVSTFYGPDGEVRGQWVKTKRDEEAKISAMLDALSTISHSFASAADPAPPPREILDEDLMCVYPMGDPHLGMHAWAQETGQAFDVAIAERNLCAAVDHLVALAPRAKRALILNLGDFFHADSTAATTTAGTRVDVDTRWGKVLSVGIRAMRRCIDRALEKHEIVDVVCEIGNHDAGTSIMLALALAQFYEREPRVRVDVSPAKFHWIRFGKVLIGVTHGDTAKMKDLAEIMACDRAVDWGETVHRYFYTGHVHHDVVKELRGVTVESFRTLAPADAWHRGQGYRSGQDMKMDVIHSKFGKINRHIVGIHQLWDSQGVSDK